MMLRMARGLPSKLASLLALKVVPHRFVASQLARPSGAFGRWVMTRALNTGNAEIVTGALDAVRIARIRSRSSRSCSGRQPGADNGDGALPSSSTRRLRCEGIGLALLGR
jgi:hypothetical protein